MLAAEPETETTFVVGGGRESITFLLPPEDIRGHLTAGATLRPRSWLPAWLSPELVRGSIQVVHLR